MVQCLKNVILMNIFEDSKSIVTLSLIALKITDEIFEFSVKKLVLIGQKVNAIELAPSTY